jgi:hypothetical protein
VHLKEQVPISDVPFELALDSMLTRIEIETTAMGEDENYIYMWLQHRETNWVTCCAPWLNECCGSDIAIR